VKQIARDVLCHRLIEGYQARAHDMTVEKIIRKILDGIEMP